MTDTAAEQDETARVEADDVGVSVTLPVGNSGDAGRRPHAGRSVAGLWARLIRRGTLLLTVAIAGYAVTEIAAYHAAYPHGVDPAQLQMFLDNPVVRMMQGVPHALDVAGGYMAWDGGWIMQVILAVWALLTASRLLRGEEETERADLLLAGPVRATVATGAALCVVYAAAVVVGAVTAVALVVSGEDLRGSVLFGVGLGGVAATFAGVAGVTSQLVEVRRKAAGLAAGVLGLAYVLRMLGSSTDPREWVLWTTPLGWVDTLNPFGEADLHALVPLCVVPVVLAAVAVALRGRRDLGGALLMVDSSRAPRLRMLGSPAAFAWRSNRGVLLAWGLGLGALAVVMGALVATMVDWLAHDADYQRMFSQMGLDQALTTLGFVSVLASMFGLAIALQVAWRVGSARAEEESGRAEALLARPVSRRRWLGGHVVLALLGGVLLVTVSGTGIWAGCIWSGLDQVSWTQAMQSVLNSLPVVVLVGGLGVLTFGLLPRLTVAVPVTVTVVGYVVTVVGPALSWPSWVLDLSPFTHLTWVPAQPWGATAGVVMAGAGLVAAAVGLLAFGRRDVVAA